MAIDTARHLELTAPERVAESGGSTRVALCGRAAAHGWDAFADAHPEATVWHRSVWLDLIEDVFGHACQRWMAHDDAGRIRGILPIVRLRSRLFGDFGVSLPFVNYGGALVTTEDVRPGLVEAARAHAAGTAMRHIEFRDRAPLAGAWPVRDDKAVLSRPLPDEPAVLWKELGSKLRAQIRRPRREGATVADSGLDRLDAFYRVFARNMRDLGTPVYDRALFRAILERLPCSFTVVVYMADEPVAAALLVGDRGRLEVPWASSLRDYNRQGVNMLLYWRCLELAIERGYREFDFGRSSVDSGSWRFKRQWGAEPTPCYWHYWLRRGHELPGLTPDNPKYRAAIELWRRLPVSVANTLGPPIVKNLP